MLNVWTNVCPYSHLPFVYLNGTKAFQNQYILLNIFNNSYKIYYDLFHWSHFSSIVPALFVFSPLKQNMSFFGGSYVTTIDMVSELTRFRLSSSGNL